MAVITTYLQKILEAVYGEEVRGSIHDAIAAMNTESSNAMQYASTAKDSAQASAAAGSAADAKTAEDNAKSIKADVETLAAQAQADKDAAENARTAAEAARDAAASALSAQQYSGKPPKPINGSWWIWDAETGQYIDSGIGCELVGPIGIADIQLTSGNHMPGTSDIYTVTLTDDTAYNISVYNGRNGTGAGDVLGIFFDLVIPAAGWRDGEITVADSRLMALATHKYFLAADEASRKEFLDCNIQPKDITATGFITFKSDTDPETDITVHLVRLEMSANGTP